MGEMSIAKSFKGILRISHILELIKNEQDVFCNPSYYGRPTKLMNISGGTYETDEIGFRMASKGMDGSITRYGESNALIAGDDLKVGRVPMTDSMGNYLNWNIGYNGVTIGSDENINSIAIDVEKFKQNDIIRQKENDFIWQQKYFPVLESGNIIIGLQNKEYPSDKYKVNKDSGLIIETKNNLGKLVIENKYDKSNPTEYSAGGKTFITYAAPNTPKKFRTIYTDNKSKVEEYDVFMYRQDDYDCHNYNYEIVGKSANDSNVRGNDIVFQQVPNKNTQIDCTAGIVNLKEYVSKIIGKFLNSSLVEVPTGTIINQYCSLDKWYAAPDDGTVDDLIEGSSYPGHRPAMMSKRDVGMLPSTQETTSSDQNTYRNAFIQSSILGASKKINKLINPNYDFSNKDSATGNETVEEENEKLQQDLGFAPEGFYKEIIPLYKRDYVLCDGSIYALWIFPNNFVTSNYPNRRETLDRFIDLFFSIGYEYTINPSYVNRRFVFDWFDSNDQMIPAYKIVRANSTKLDNESLGEHLVTSSNCLKYKDSDNKPDDGYPKIGDYPDYLDKDRHALFVEDFLTILAFDEIYKKYSEAGDVSFRWTTENINNFMSKLKVPEKYRLNTFVGDSVDTIKKFINRTNLTIGDDFIMELPYYNFNKDGDETITDAQESKLPLIRLGREVKTFGDPIKFWDKNENKWVIVEAYKIPQIQYFIDLFSNYPTVDTLAPCLNTFFEYTFQVPNLCGNIPTFIGSSGLCWSDTQHRKVRQIESWTSNYAQMNTQHRHFIFNEPDVGELSLSEYHQIVNEPNPHAGNTSGPNNNNYHKSSTIITGETHVSPANLFGGGCGDSKEYETGKTGHINYIWNELGDDDGRQRYAKINFTNDQTNNNGYCFPIIQNSSTDKVSWTTGDYRKNRKASSTDLKINVLPSNKSYSNENLPDIKSFTDSCWDKDYVDFGHDYTSKKAQYEKDTGWYGWEHDEDPRFDSHEPNRGRTSIEKEQTIKTNTVSYARYNKNKENFNITLDQNITDAEWFSPENIKMLPLIKL